MSQKKADTKGGPVWKLSRIEATLAAKPLYNGFSCGYGIHGDVKYNRAKERTKFQDLMDDYT